MNSNGFFMELDNKRRLLVLINRRVIFTLVVLAVFHSSLLIKFK